MMIHLDKVTKLYGNKTAVYELSLEVPAGELFAFLGPNGAGKTTTIKMMCGLLFPTTGRVCIGGHDLKTDGDRARAMLSYVPDKPFLYEKLTGREFLEFIGEMYGLPEGHRTQRLREVIDLFSLGEFVDDLTERYSHGMRQRTVFAAALLHEPQVLLFDEPASGLDPRARIEMRALLKELRKMGKTILVSSHILPELADICNKIGIIERGKLLAAGSIQQIQQQIRSHRVLKVRVLGQTTGQAAEMLRSDAAIRAVEIFDHTVTAEFEGQDQDMARLLDRLVHGGIVVQSFAEEPLSLEEVFMMITKGIVS